MPISLRHEFKGSYERDFIFFQTFFFGIFVSLVLFIISLYFYHDDTSLYLKSIGFFIFIICSAFSVRFQLLHPFVWFNVPFMLYSLSAPFLYLIGEYRYHYTYPETINLEYIAVLSSSVIVGIGNRARSFEKMKYDKFELLIKGNNWFFLMSLIVALIYLGSIVLSGIQEKGMKVTQFSIFFGLEFAYYFLNISMCIYLIDNMSKKVKIPLFNLTCFIGFLVLSFLICGERSVIFIFILTFILIYSLYNKVKPMYLLILSISVLFLSTLSGYFKMFLLSKQMIGTLEMEMSGRYIARFLLGSELLTASQNLALLIELVPEQNPFFLGETFLWDLRKAFIPNFFFPRSLFLNTTAWFNKTFFPYYWDKGHGVGFTLVGLGYLNYGFIGVICLFSILGVVWRITYKWSLKSVWGLIFYVNSIIVWVYSIRADLSAPISRSIKHIMLPLLIISLIGSFKRKKSKSQ